VLRNTIGNNALPAQVGQVILGEEALTYCNKCAQKMEPGAQFCTSCGAAAGVAAQPAAPSWQPVPGPPAQAFAPVKKRGGLTLLLIFLSVLALIAVIGIGGVVYVGYKVKEKVTSVAETITHPASSAGENKESGTAKSDTNDVSAILGNLGGMLGKADDSGDAVESISVKDPVTPCTAAPFPSQSSARIPMQADTAITIAWGIKNGDVETRNLITSTNDTSLIQMGSVEAYKEDDGEEAKA
jgi:hypothetical protein